LLTRASRIACYEHRSARALSLSRLIFQPVAAGAVDLGLTFGSEKLVSNINAAFYGFVQNKAQALLDVNFYNVCDDQEGKIMFERLITAIIMVVAVAIVASGLPLSSMSGAGSGALGFFNLSPIF
jgi:hypothetical protein